MPLKQTASQYVPASVKSLLKFRRLAKRSETAWSDPAAQRLLALQFREMKRSDSLPETINDAGFQVFSASDEDGILLYLFSIFGTATRTFVDIGAAGIEGSNTANLVVNHGWHGLHIDGSRSALAFAEQFYRSRTRSRPFPPATHTGFVDSENVNQLLEDYGYRGEIDLLSIDIDSTDYWVWQAINVVSPRVVIMEFQAALGEQSLTIPNTKTFDRSAHAINSPPFEVVYCGVSLAALVHLAHEKGYDFVGCDSLRVNAFFVRSDVNDGALAEADVKECMQHPRVRYLVEKYAEDLATYPWEQVGP